MMTPFDGTFEEAERACGTGYINADLLRLVVAKTIAFRDSPLSTTLTWSAVPGLIPGLLTLLPKNETLRILDLGGAAGHHFFDIRSKFPELNVRWAVLETLAMTEAARPLETERLRFFSEAEDALTWLGGVDLIHASGVLQCLRDPVALLGSLRQTGAPAMVFSRTICLRDGPIIAIQSSRLTDHGPGPAPAGTPDATVLTPFVLRPRDEYIEALAPAYQLRARWRDHNAYYSFGGSSLVSQEFLFRLVG